MATAFQNIAYRVELQTVDYNDSVFPTAQIIDSNGVTLTTLSLPLSGDGLYYLPYTFTVVGTYTIKFKVFTDVGHTTLSDYQVSLESVSVQPPNGISIEELQQIIYNTMQQLFQNQGSSAGCTPSPDSCNTSITGETCGNNSLGLDSFGSALDTTSNSSNLS